MAERKQAHDGILGGFRHLVEDAAVAAGVATRVPDSPVQGDEESDVVAEANTAPVLPRSQPSVPGSTAPADTTTSTGSSLVSDAEVDEQVRIHLATIFQATPDAFRTFLSQRDALRETLRDSVDAEKLEAAATKAAYAVAKLTKKDVASAMSTAKDELKRVRANFDTDFRQKRTERIDGPTQKIEGIKTHAEQIAQQIIDLTRQKSELEASIAPLQQAIARAEDDMKYLGAIIDSSCGKMADTITAMETQLNSFTGGKRS